MECLNIDYVGPYPDKTYVFVIIDTFTTWVELFHSPEATGKKMLLKTSSTTLVDSELLLNFDRTEALTL
jgi:hypothetical protein